MTPLSSSPPPSSSLSSSEKTRVFRRYHGRNTSCSTALLKRKGLLYNGSMVWMMIMMTVLLQFSSRPTLLCGCLARTIDVEFVDVRLISLRFPSLDDGDGEEPKRGFDLQNPYRGTMASFGDPLLDGAIVNLYMAPMDDNKNATTDEEESTSFLCEFPSRVFENQKAVDRFLAAFESLQLQQQQNETLNVTLEDAKEETPFPIGLIAHLGGGCSPEQKALVAMEIQELIAPVATIRVLLLAETNHDEGEDDQDRQQMFHHLYPKTLDSSTSPPPKELSNLAILHVPYHAHQRLQKHLEDLSTRSGHPPFLMEEGSEFWNLQAEISELEIAMDGSSTHAPEPDDDLGNDDMTPPAAGYPGPPSQFFWFRVTLFVILILSPCFRAIYLFYAAGARIHFRRSERGWIVGLQYIPPMPFWLNGTQSQSESRVCTTLTEEQFNTLPEVTFKGLDRDDQDDGDNNNNNDNNQEEGDVVENQDNGDGRPNTTAASEGQAGSNADTNKILRMSSSSSSISRHGSSRIREGTEGDGDIELGSIQDATVSDSAHHSIATSPTAVADTSNNGSSPMSGEMSPSPETDTSESAANAGSSSAEIAVTAATSGEEGPAQETSRSSECSICIDDFEIGEKVMLLPRCQHAFHRECLRPWLLERQGCCPLCKVSVLASETLTDADADSSSASSPADES